MAVAGTVSVEIEFSEPFLPTTVSPFSIYLQHNGTTVKSDPTYVGNFNRATRRPTGSLEAGAAYSAVVATDVADLSGNGLADTDSWSFVTQFPSWHVQAVGSYQTGDATAIAQDYNETPYVGFQVVDGLPITKLTALGVGETESLTGGENAGRYYDFAISANNVSHTALKYAARIAIGTWHTQVVDNSSTTGAGSSIIMGGQL